jgi:hypothetical protein
MIIWGWVVSVPARACHTHRTHRVCTPCPDACISALPPNMLTLISCIFLLFFPDPVRFPRLFFPANCTQAHLSRACAYARERYIRTRKVHGEHPRARHAWVHSVLDCACIMHFAFFSPSFPPRSHPHTIQAFFSCVLTLRHAHTHNAYRMHAITLRHAQRIPTHLDTHITHIACIPTMLC